MFTINIQGKENPKSPELVKFEMVFFKSGYPRVTKIINISGPIKAWDLDGAAWSPVQWSHFFDKEHRA